MSTYASSTSDSVSDSDRVVMKAHYWKFTDPFVYKYLANAQRAALIWRGVLRALSRYRAAGHVYIQTTTLEKPEWDADVGWMCKIYKLFILIEVQPECVGSLHDENFTEMQFRAFLANECRNTVFASGDSANTPNCKAGASTEIAWDIDHCTGEALVYQKFLDAQNTYANDEYVY